MTEQRAISIFDQKLDEVKDKLIEVPPPIQSFFQRILDQVKVKHALLSETVNQVSGSPEVSQIGGLMSSFDPSKLMEFVSQASGMMQKVNVKQEDIDFWRTNPELLEVLAFDPRARYMYVATPLLPSLSILYLEFNVESKPLYVLFASKHETPHVYSENILTQELVHKIFQEESSQMNPMVSMMLLPQISQYFDVDKFWTFLDPKLNPKPVLNRRRPVYVEEL
jgi:hypothetical protein